MLLSELQYRVGDLTAAIKVLSTAIEKFPYTSTPYENLAICYLHGGDIAKASEISQRGLQFFRADRNLLRLKATVVHP